VRRKRGIIEEAVALSPRQRRLDRRRRVPSPDQAPGQVRARMCAPVQSPQNGPVGSLFVRRPAYGSSAIPVQRCARPQVCDGVRIDRTV
jgi:hypothetical protein